MIQAPRILAIDDETKHLEGLVKALGKIGVGCLPIPFSAEEVDQVKACRNVRIIFCDLFLLEGSTSEKQQFGMIETLIKEQIKPSGPYILVLWTENGEHADNLKPVLDTVDSEEVSRPLSIMAIDKAPYLDPSGEIERIGDLVEEIKQHLEQYPQIEAILDWEERILGAAADTVSSLVKIAKPEGAKKLAQLLAGLAEESVGSQHVDTDRFHAINEALLPIVADHISRLRTCDKVRSVWERAFSMNDVVNLTPVQAASLNQKYHIEFPTDTSHGAERGAVVSLQKSFPGTSFDEIFGISSECAAKKAFGAEGYTDDDERFRWVLIQSQAACDYAQKNEGPLPFFLGLDMESSGRRQRGYKPPAALRFSPPFMFGREIRILSVNARFQISLAANKARSIESIYRLRNQLLEDIIHHAHANNVRPGFISFRSN